jgi:hypothetical protein
MKEENLVIYDNMGKSGGHYGKWKESGKKTNILWSFFYVEHMEVNPSGAEVRMEVASGWGMEEMGRCSSKSIQFQWCRLSMFWKSSVQNGGQLM